MADLLGIPGLKWTCAILPSRVKCTLVSTGIHPLWIFMSICCNPELALFFDISIFSTSFCCSTPMLIYARPEQPLSDLCNTVTASRGCRTIKVAFCITPFHHSLWLSWLILLRSTVHLSLHVLYLYNKTTKHGFWHQDKVQSYVGRKSVEVQGHFTHFLEKLI